MNLNSIKATTTMTIQPPVVFNKNDEQIVSCKMCPIQIGLAVLAVIALLMLICVLIVRFVFGEEKMKNHQTEWSKTKDEEASFFTKLIYWMSLGIHVKFDDGKADNSKNSGWLSIIAGYGILTAILAGSIIGIVMIRQKQLEIEVK